MVLSSVSDICWLTCSLDSFASSICFECVGSLSTCDFPAGWTASVSDSESLSMSGNSSPLINSPSSNSKVSPNWLIDENCRLSTNTVELFKLWLPTSDSGVSCSEISWEKSIKKKNHSKKSVEECYQNFIILLDLPRHVYLTNKCILKGTPTYMHTTLIGRTLKQPIFWS